MLSRLLHLNVGDTAKLRILREYGSKISMFFGFFFITCPCYILLCVTRPIVNNFYAIGLQRKYPKTVAYYFHTVDCYIFYTFLYILLFIEGKPWPLIFGMGTGFGHGVANCQNDYRNITSLRKETTVRLSSLYSSA